MLGGLISFPALRRKGSSSLSRKFWPHGHRVRVMPGAACHLENGCIWRQLASGDLVQLAIEAMARV